MCLEEDPEVPAGEGLGRTSEHIRVCPFYVNLDYIWALQSILKHTSIQIMHFTVMFSRAGAPI